MGDREEAKNDEQSKWEVGPSQAKIGMAGGGDGKQEAGSRKQEMEGRAKQK